MIPIYLKLSSDDFLLLDESTLLILGWLEGMAMMGESSIYFPNDGQSIFVSSDEGSINTPTDSQEIFLSATSGMVSFPNNEGIVHGT